jgi:hypothetical protein
MGVEPFALNVPPVYACGSVPDTRRTGVEALDVFEPDVRVRS